MAAERRQYSAEFKREAVRLMSEGGVSLAQVSRDLGVCRSLLGKWKRQVAVEQQTGMRGVVRAFPGHGQPADEELTRLRRENEILRQEREILKKAVAIFTPQLR